VSFLLAAVAGTVSNRLTDRVTPALVWFILILAAGMVITYSLNRHEKMPSNDKGDPKDASVIDAHSLAILPDSSDDIGVLDQESINADNLPARWEEIIELPLQYHYKSTDSWDTYTAGLSLKKIFGIVGSCMFDEDRQAHIFYILSKYLEAMGQEQGKIRAADDNEFLYSDFSGETQGLVLTRLLTEGVIESSVRKRSVRDHNTYWKLTGRGREFLSAVLAQ
jgi:hypothetical protein